MHLDIEATSKRHQSLACPTRRSPTSPTKRLSLKHKSSFFLLESRIRPEKASPSPFCCRPLLSYLFLPLASDNDGDPSRSKAARTNHLPFQTQSKSRSLFLRMNILFAYHARHRQSIVSPWMSPCLPRNAMTMGTNAVPATVLCVIQIYSNPVKSSLLLRGLHGF